MAKARKRTLSIIGVTLEGRLVMGGLFKLADTCGFPLADSILECERRNMVAGLHDYALAARKAHWPTDRIVGKIREAFHDLGRPFPKQVEEKLALMFRVDRKDGD
jgi:hypothetical protein